MPSLVLVILLIVVGPITANAQELVLAGDEGIRKLRPDEFGPVVDGLQIAVYFRNSEVRLGEPLEAIVLLRNASDKKIWFALGPQEYDHQVIVTDEAGNVVPLRKEAALEREKRSALGYRFMIGGASFEPGPNQQQSEYRVDLTCQFDLRPGEVYNVVISRNRYSQKPDAVMVSKPVEFKILPPAGIP